MKYARPNIDQETALRVLHKSLGYAPQELVFLEEEHISAAFEFELDEEHIIIEFREPCMAYGFMKEKLLQARLRHAGVPLRDVIGEGEYGHWKFTISKKPRGVKLASLDPRDFGAILPAVFETLLACAAVDLSATQGYGWFNRAGIGSETTWQAHLARIKDEEPGYFFGEWHTLFATTFLERRRFNHYYARMVKLLEKLTLPRALVHGSFSPYTVFADQGEITAVCDWQDTRFGDHLFDVASLDYWPTGYNLVDLFYEFCVARGLAYTDYRQRIISYKYYQSLGNMIYFAKIDNREAYEAVIEIADGLEAHID